MKRKPLFIDTNFTNSDGTIVITELELTFELFASFGKFKESRL